MDRIQVKAGEVCQLRDVIAQLVRERIPARAVLRVVRVARAVDAEAANLAAALETLNTRHILLVDGQPVPNGQNSWQVKDAEAYTADVRELYAQVVELPTFRLSELVSPHSEESTGVAALLLALGSMVVDDMPEGIESE
jgi:hypothetical protein